MNRLDRMDERLDKRLGKIEGDVSTLKDGQARILEILRGQAGARIDRDLARKGA
jgi:hypothetical protein